MPTSAFKAWTTIPYRQGWPVNNVCGDYGSQILGSPMTEDVDNNIKKEIFFSIGNDAEGTLGGILAFNEDGKEYINYDGNPTYEGGFYKFNTASSSCTPAIGDIDGNGSKDLLITTRPNQSANTDAGKVFAFSTVNFQTPDTPDILWSTDVFSNYKGAVIAQQTSTEQAHVGLKSNWDANPFLLTANNGIPINNWPQSTCDAGGYGMPVIADIDNDGYNEFIMGVAKKQGTPAINAGIYVWKADGTVYPYHNSAGAFYQVKTGTNLDFDRMDSPPVVAEIDGISNTPELIFVSSESDKISTSTPEYYTGHIFILNNQGQTISGWDYNSHLFQIVSSDDGARMPAPVVGDVDDDGEPEIFVAGLNYIYGWKKNGQALPHFPISVPNLETRFIAPLLADVDGDGTIEIVVASNSLSGGIYAFNINSGLIITGWPVQIGRVDATPCIDDIDNDGKSELIVSTHDIVHVFNTQGKSDRILWGKFRGNTFNNAVYSMPCQYSSTPLHIYGNEIYYDKTISSDIIIEPGGSLTVKGKVNMPLQSRIFVKEGSATIGGGKLIIDGGKITTECNGLWKGIEVWGNPNISQTAVTSTGALIQGQVTLLHGGAVWNAEIGVLASARPTDDNDDNPYGYTGGIISADSAFFVNNSIALQFDPYRQYNFARFTRTHFRTTAALQNNSLPDYFVKAYAVNPILFRACTFKNTRRDNEVFYEARGNGIYSFNSGIQIDTYCPDLSSPCTHLQLSKFEKLTRGIYALNGSDDHVFYIHETKFLDNIYGAYFSAYNSNAYLQVLSSTFRNGPPYPVNGYSLYLDQCTGFHVEDNEFHQEDTELKGIGLIVNNSGISPNEIYRNKFHNLKVATLSQNDNSNYDPGNHDIGGLCYRCNKFVKDDLSEPNLFDFAITYDNSFNSHTGIARNQGGTWLGGSSFSPAGNMFKPSPSSFHYDFYNEGNSVTYHYHATNQSYFRIIPQPANIYGPVTTAQENATFSYESSCPSTLTGGGSSEDNLDLVLAQSQSDSINLLLTNLVDGGSTELLNFDVQTSTTSQAMALTNELLNKSPYLSDTVMKNATEKENVLNNAMIRDVLVANPQSAKSEDLMDLLANRTIPMPDYMMEQILAGEDTVSPKELLEAGKSWWDGAADKTYTRLLNYYKGDTTGTANEDSLIWLFNIRNKLSAKFDKAEWFHSKGDTLQAEETLNSIPAMFSLNSAQEDTREAYQTFFDLNDKIKSDTAYAFSIDSVMKSSLLELTTSNQDLPGIYARNLLLATGNISYQEPVILPDTGLKATKRVKFKGVKEHGNNEFLSVFPNPAHDYFIVRFNKPEDPKPGYLKLYNSKGILMFFREVSTANGQITVPAAGLNSGLYLLVLEQNSKRVGMVKLTIIK